MNLYDRVLDFMAHFGQIAHRELGQPALHRFAIGPSVPPDDVVRNRCRWQVEEALELLSACFRLDADGPSLYLFDKQKEAMAHCRRVLGAIIDEAPVSVDLVAYADANADIRYVAYGNDIAAGIYSPDVDAEVCRSNDTKSPPGPDGKVRKGDNYSPPDIAGVLKEQGWKG